MVEILFVTFAGSFLSYYVAWNIGVCMNNCVVDNTKKEQQKIHNKLDKIIQRLNIIN